MITWLIRAYSIKRRLSIDKNDQGGARAAGERDALSYRNVELEDKGSPIF
jgi:hypothetical protein